MMSISDMFHTKYWYASELNRTKAELTRLRELVRELINLPKSFNDAESEIFEAICNRPEVKAVMEAK